MNRKLAWSDEPARSPACHRVRLGKTSKRDHPIRHLRGEAGNVAISCKTCVDLIGDQPQVVPLGELADRRQLRFVEYHATRIIWGRPDDGPRALCNQGSEGSQIRAEVTACRCSDHPRTGCFEGCRICWIHWVERDHLITRPG